MNKLKAFILMLPFIGMSCWAVYYAQFTRNATDVILPITGYDPRNFLSGHYIEFKIDWKKADCNQADWNGICPKESFNKVRRYYVPEDKAVQLEQLINRRGGEIVFSYQKGFRPVAKALLIKGQPWEEFLKNPDYEGASCYTQEDCGGTNSGYFCNSFGTHASNKCEKTKPETITVNGKTFYYNRLDDLKSWCREATESQEDRASPGNCSWGYLSFTSAKMWCASIGKSLVSADEINQNCEQFSFLPRANPDQQYWTQGFKVVHMGQGCSIQKMVRGDGYSWAGGVICQEWPKETVIRRGGSVIR